MEQQRISRFRVLGKIAAGGMGEVYRAHDDRLGRDVAIKVLPKELSRSSEWRVRFEREARLAASLDHPNILGVYDVGTHRGQHFIVTELLYGSSLRKLIGEGLSCHQAVEIGVQIAQGLAAAHERGIIHRDLKPDNVMVTRDGVVKILDFGLAKVSQPEPTADLLEASTEASPTSPGTVLGTPGYLAPEQARGQGVDHRADIFALGCVLYEMLSGRRAFRGETAADVIAAILHDDPAPLGGDGRPVPRQLQRIVARCLEKRPEDRFQSARDVAFTLLAAGRGDSTAAQRPVPRSWRRRALIATAALAILGVAALALGLRRWLTAGHPATASWASRRLTASGGWNGEPAISPDGTLVAFTSSKDGNRDVWVLDVRGSDAIRLTSSPEAEGRPAWLPDQSAVLYVAEHEGGSDVMRVPRLGGMAELLIADATDPAVSPDGTRIAFARHLVSGSSRIGVAPLADPARAVMLTGNGDGLWDHAFPAWSPDGKEICYSDFRDLWRVPADGGPARRFTFDHATDRRPAWSADGFIHFSSGREGGWAVWGIRARGGRPWRLTTASGCEVGPSVSRDGSRLVYATQEFFPDLVVVDRESGAAARATSRSVESAPAFLPDGSGVVFCSNRAGKFDLWHQPLTGGHPAGQPRQVTNHPGSVATPAISRDGRWLAYLRVAEGQRDIWVMVWPPGVPHPLIQHPARDIHPAFSPDGSHLAFVSDRNGHEHIFLQPIRQGRAVGVPRQLTGGRARDLFPCFSPDGASIAFIRSEGREADVWVVPAGGGEGVRVTQGARVGAVRWHASGESVEVLAEWGSGRPSLRRVHLSTGRVGEEDPHFDGGGMTESDMFDLSADGRSLVHLTASLSGDLWLLERQR